MSNSWKDLELWDHQKEAISLGVRYLNSHKKVETTKAALIRMPTGTGKTGVISVLARRLDKKTSVLVLVPSKALKNQFIREIESQFWQKISTNIDGFPKSIEGFTPQYLGKILCDMGTTPVVFVSTMQSISTLYNDDQYEEIFLDLKEKIDFIIIDEGHREPAPVWAKAVRSLEKPTILFTATPYRNDYAFFDIDPNYSFVFNFHDAVSKKYIRSVNFEETNFVDDIDTDANYLVEYYEKVFLPKISKSSSNARVIIRCRTRTTVIAMANALDNLGQKVIAIHEGLFASEDRPYFFKSVPEPESTEAIFWIHQYKLLEGIDDSKFQLLVIYDSFANSRSLVQQVGRIIRNPERKSNQKAFVLVNEGFGQKQYWESYLKFEEVETEHYDSRNLFEETLKRLPKMQYIEGGFRERFDIEKDDFHLAFEYRHSANIFDWDESNKFQEVVKEVELEWRDSERIIGKVSFPEENTVVFSYIVPNMSPILLNDFFIELKLGYTIIRLENNHLFFSDSRGSVPKSLQKDLVPLSSTLLAQLFSGLNDRASSISLSNSDTGRQSIRRRVIHAYDIADTAPMLTDHGYFYSTLQAQIYDVKNESIGRYIGFRNGRVTDQDSGILDYKSYIRWVEKISSNLMESTIHNKVLDRYAIHVDAPDDPTPKHILFDISDLLDSEAYVSIDDKVPLKIDDISMEVEDGKFTLHANEEIYKITIVFNSKNSKYRLSNSKLNSAFVPNAGQNVRQQGGIIAYLNSNQAFRVIPKSGGFIYAHSKFYQLQRSYGKNAKKLELLEIIRPTDGLDLITSEKGPKKSEKPSGWARKSLFQFIDVRGRNPNKYTDELAKALKHTDILVCDDLHKECADFIVASKKDNRIIFIHAKAKKQTLSASGFQDVCGQVVKNLESLIPYYDYQPPNLERWDEPWVRNGPEMVSNRIRKGKGTSKEVWKELSEIIENPLSTKEVWIVYGKGFSKSEFEKQLEKDDPTPETVQLVFLLQSTWAAVYSVGAKLKIFCPDFNAK